MITREEVKKAAKRLGADIVGIASAKAINENPPDPRWPQTVERIWPECRSVIAIGKRLPWGMFRAPDPVVNRTVPILVMMKLDHIALDIAYYVEDNGFHAFPAPLEYTDSSLKSGSYGSLSLRHVAIEAGLGTLGLNMLLLTPELGPRLYVSAVLTDAEIEPDGKREDQLCPGPSCGRCLTVCPSDAVEHWGLNKRLCSLNAQPSGVSKALAQMEALATAETLDERRRLIRGQKTVDLWQSTWRGVGAYGGCPKCLEVCPVGEDFKKHLKPVYQRVTPPDEQRAEKLEKLRSIERAEESPGASAYSRRWVGDK